MKGARIIALAMASLLLSLAAPPAALATKPLPPGTFRYDQVPFRLEARILQLPERPGEDVEFELTVTSTGDEALIGYLPTPCDSPFDVTVTQDGSGQEIARLTRPSRSCIQVIAPFALQPGQSYSERFRWAGPRGDYTVRAAFTLPGDGYVISTTVRFPLAIRPTHWVDAYLPEAIGLGLIGEAEAGRFDPDELISRAAFRHLLTRAGGLAEYLNVGQPDYDARVTREEAAIMVVQALGLDDVPTPTVLEQLEFSDRIQVSGSLAPYVRAAARLGIVNGYADGTFRPRAWISRAEALVIAIRMQGANTFQVDPGGVMEVNGNKVPIPGIAVLKRIPGSPIGLSPLSDLARAAGIQVTVTDGWYVLNRGDLTMRVKPHLSYGVCSAEAMPFCHTELNDGKVVSIPFPPPVVIGGELYVPRQVPFMMGLKAEYDPANVKFTVSP